MAWAGGWGPALGVERPRRPVAGQASAWTLAAVGDAIITRRVSPFSHDGDPGFRDLVRLIRGADAAILNLELSLFRFSEFKGWAEVENGGDWKVGPPEGATELKEMGFLLMSRANNHATDYGVEGMRVTDALLDRLGVVHAGTGENLGHHLHPHVAGRSSAPRHGRPAGAQCPASAPQVRGGPGNAGAAARPGGPLRRPRDGAGGSHRI